MRRAAFLDLDGTLLNGCSSAILLEELIKQPGVHPEYGQAALQAANRKEKKGPSTLRGGIYANLPLAVKGLHPSVMDDAAHLAWPNLQKSLFPFARDLVSLLREGDYTTFLVTGAMAQMATLAADFMGVDVCIGAVLRVEGQAFTGELTRAPAQAGMKSELVKSWITSEKFDASTSFALGNGIRDAEMMELVGRAVAFEPDYDLEPVAHKNDWLIADRHTVMVVCEELVRG